MEQLTPAMMGWIIGITLTLGVTVTVWQVRDLIGAWLGELFHRYVHVTPSPHTYVSSGDGAVVHTHRFPASRLEAEAEAEAETTPEDGAAIVHITEHALQERDAANVEAGMIQMLAIVTKGEHLLPGRLTKIKVAAFQIAGGRALSRLNAAINAVAVPAAEPTPARVSPIAQRPLPRAARFVTDDDCEVDAEPTP